MELRHLRYFVTLADCLNFTRAAERMHVTQSTLSHQIRQLEDEIGQRLFERSGKRVSLTESGTLFLESARNALQEVDQGLSALRYSTEDLVGDLRIGTTHTFNLHFIPECVASFLVRHPTVRVQIHELAADAIASALNDGTLDLGIAYQPGAPTSLWFEPLYSEEMALVVNPDHPLASRRRIRMVELHHQRLVLLPPTFATRAMLDDCFRACGIAPVVAAEMNTIAPMLGLVARTPIGAIVAAKAVPASLALRVVPIESPTPVRTPGILWLRGAKQSLQTRSFASIVRKLALSGSLRSGIGQSVP